MSRALTITRAEHTAADLRPAAGKCRDNAQVRRLLALRWFWTDVHSAGLFNAGILICHLDRLNSGFDFSLRRVPAYSSVRFILRGLDAADIEGA